MTRYVVDEPAFRAMMRGSPLVVGRDEIILAPNIGWLAQIQATIDAAKSGLPQGAPTMALRPNPPDPPETNELNTPVHERRRGRR